VIQYTFEVLSLERHARCDYDSVTVYDGPDANARMLGKYCRVMPADAVKSTGPSVFVVFKSDRYVNAGRFKLIFTFEIQTDLG